VRSGMASELTIDLPTRLSRIMEEDLRLLRRVSEPLPGIRPRTRITGKTAPTAILMIAAENWARDTGWNAPD